MNQNKCVSVMMDSLLNGCVVLLPPTKMLTISINLILATINHFLRFQRNLRDN
jgi:hypothetical protein